MAKQKQNTKDNPVKKTSNQSKVDEAISHILGVLEIIEDRLTVLEEEPDLSLANDYLDDVDTIDSRLSKVEGRMGL
jgi:hypothetical protein|tara:strand:+ start:476 stop:703 length:228 start_codon:yes stop_codon:yes gene_type:complete